MNSLGIPALSISRESSEVRRVFDTINVHRIWTYALSTSRCREFVFLAAGLLLLSSLALKAEEGKMKPTLVHSGTSSVLAACFSPASNMLVVALQNGTVLVYRTADSKLIGKTRKHKASVTSLCFSSDGKKLASASLDTTVRTWAVVGPAARQCRNVNRSLACAV
jgi:WD40 repeat protein